LSPSSRSTAICGDSSKARCPTRRRRSISSTSSRPTPNASTLS
jgi:hypothetical protein